MSRILALDTVTGACSVALSLGTQVIRRAETVGTGHSQILLDMVGEVLAEAGLAPGQLDAVAVDCGPGSFTGVRIGLGVAQGLAYGADLPAVGISSLEALAAAAGPGLVLPALDARMGQVYCALYRVVDGARPEELEAPAVADPGALPFAAPGVDHAPGSGWAEYGEALAAALGEGGKNCRRLPGARPDAADIARLADLAGPGARVAPGRLAASYVRDRVATPPGGGAG